MEIKSNTTSHCIHILAALKSKVGYYKKNLLAQIIEGDPKNLRVIEEIQLIDQLEKSIKPCLNEVGLNQQYNIKLLRSPDLSNSLNAGTPHCGTALHVYTSYLLYTLCRSIYLDDTTTNLILPIAAYKEWMIHLHLKAL